MVTKLILFDKIYNISSERQKKDIFKRYKKYLNQLIRGFSHTSIELGKLRESDSRVEILIEGPEEEFVKNLLEAEIGRFIKFNEIKKGVVLKGTLVNVGKVGFGLFLDCGIIDPPTDVLIPLYKLRNQLADEKKVSLKKIINTYDFINHFPLFIKIIGIDDKEKNLEGEIAENSLSLYKKVVEENIEALFLCGETKAQFKNALIKKGHLQDIISFKRYGFLEHLVLLKKGTNARGIISEIGRFLEGCKFSILSAKRIRKLKS